MNKPRILPKSLKYRGPISKRVNKAIFFISVIGYICKASENQYFTVNRCKQAEVTLVFVHICIFLHH